MKVSVVTTICDSCGTQTAVPDGWFQTSITLVDAKSQAVNKSADICPPCVETKGWPDIYSELGELIKL